LSEQPLAGKVAVVTGAGSTIGLGRAMSLALVKAGARVAMVDVDQASLDQSVTHARAIGGDASAIPIVADVTQPQDGERVVAETIKQLGQLGILINNAGVNPRINAQPGRPAFTQIPVDEWLLTISVNVNGPFFMARAAAIPMVEQGWGRIIGVTTSLDTMFRGVPYGPTKAAHEAFIAAMASQLEGTGVTANVLIPGRGVATNMTGGPRTDGGPDTRLQPEVMQQPAVWLASPASDGFNNRRLVAELWDEELPIEERLAKASAPAAWPQLGRQAATPAG
jgi:NAD(P)-dependent dehydrogenase (short-subunit alcohol dehydrogenase family)